MPALIREWTPERLETLSRLWRQGHPASFIAMQLGTTRNAILGRVHKMGLTRRPGEKRRRELAERAARIAQKSMPKAPRPVPEKHEPVVYKISKLWDMPEADRRMVMAMRAAAGARATRLGVRLP